MICPSCGARVSDKASFCGRCGCAFGGSGAHVHPSYDAYQTHDGNTQSFEMPQARQTPPMQQMPIAQQAPMAQQMPPMQQVPMAPQMQPVPQTYTAPAGMAAPVRPAPPATYKFTALNIIGRIVAIAVIVLMFMPILNIPALSEAHGKYSSSELNALATEVVGSDAARDLDMITSGSYSALDLNRLCQYAAATSSRKSDADMFRALGAVCIGFLAVQVALLALGLVGSFFFKRKATMLRVACLITFALSLMLALDIILVNVAMQNTVDQTLSDLIGTTGVSLGSTYIAVPITLWALAICSLAAFVLVDLGIRKQLAGVPEPADPIATSSLIISFFVPFVSFIMSIIGIVRARRASRVISIIALVISILSVFLMASGLAAAGAVLSVPM